MLYQVSIAVELRWPLRKVGEILAGDPGVLLGLHRRPLQDRESDFPVQLSVSVGHNGAIAHGATLHVCSSVTRADRALAVTITPTARSRLLPTLKGTLSAVACGTGSRLVLAGTARVPLGQLFHRRGGRRRLEHSLRDLVAGMAANIDRDLDEQRRAEARRAALPLGSPERYGRWVGGAQPHRG